MPARLLGTIAVQRAILLVILARLTPYIPLSPREDCSGLMRLKIDASTAVKYHGITRSPLQP